MEDFILREIDKIGQLLRGILHKFGLAKQPEIMQAACEVTKTELADQLGLNIDTLLEQDDFIGILVTEHGFNHDNLDKFAELLFDFWAAAEDTQEKAHFGASVCEIYKYLDEKKAAPSLNRYYILKELNNQ